MKAIAFLLTACLAAPCFAVNTSYSTNWIANPYGTNATHVGNAARSLWVDPSTTGVVYTASAWDENEGSIAIYNNGVNAGSIGAHNEAQGSAITGNSTNIWAPHQYNSNPGTQCPQTNGCVYRYVRATGANDDQIAVSADTTELYADIITGMAQWGGYWYASDHPGNRVRIYTTADVWQLDISITGPGALAAGPNGDIYVAQESTGAIQHYSLTGTLLGTLQLPAGEVPHSLYFDPSTQYLWIGDAGPDENVKIYNTTNFTLVGTFGVPGGYLDTTTGTMGQIGDQRFARIDGIGKDASGNLYILDEPWGRTWDMGRTGGTDLYVYNTAHTLAYTLKALNFEAIAAPDPATDATVFYSGTNIYTGTGGSNWSFTANTVNPFAYPSDQRINVADSQRGEHFGQIADVNGNRILVASSQNPDTFWFYGFNPATSGYIAIPGGSLPGPAPFNQTAPVRNGFCLSDNGDVWAGLDKTNTIYHWPLTGFSNGVPQWGAPVTVATPSTIAPLGRIIYLPESDTMILVQALTTDWTGIATRVEVYHGWLGGNTTNPNPVITLTSTNPKSVTAAGNYLFVGYVHTVPNIDAFNLTTGTLDLTMTNSNPNNVYVGNDVDSMYGLRAMLRSNGEYVVTKDDYNGTSVVVYRWTP